MFPRWEVLYEGKFVRKKIKRVLLPLLLLLFIAYLNSHSPLPTPSFSIIFLKLKSKIFLDSANECMAFDYQVKMGVSKNRKMNRTVPMRIMDLLETFQWGVFRLNIFAVLSLGGGTHRNQLKSYRVSVIQTNWYSRPEIESQPYQSTSNVHV